MVAAPAAVEDGQPCHQAAAAGMREAAAGRQVAVDNQVAAAADRQVAAAGSQAAADTQVAAGSLAVAVAAGILVAAAGMALRLQSQAFALRTPVASGP